MNFTLSYFTFGNSIATWSEFYYIDVESVIFFESTYESSVWASLASKWRYEY